MRSHDRFANRVPQGGSRRSRGAVRGCRMPRGRRGSARFSKTSTKPASAPCPHRAADIRRHGCCSSSSGVRQQIAASGEAVRTQGLIPAARHDVAWVKAPEHLAEPPGAPMGGPSCRHPRNSMRGHSDVKFYSMTSSARARSDSGMVRPIALAVLRLTTISYRVGCCTGRSMGLAPLRILST